MIVYNRAVCKITTSSLACFLPPRRKPGLLPTTTTTTKHVDATEPVKGKKTKSCIAALRHNLIIYQQPSIILTLLWYEVVSHLIGFPAVFAIAPFAGCDAVVVEGAEAASGGKVRGRRASTVVVAEIAASKATSDNTHQLSLRSAEKNMRKKTMIRASKWCKPPSPYVHGLRSL